MSAPHAVAVFCQDLLMFQISPISSIYTIFYGNLYNSFTHHKSLVVFKCSLRIKNHGLFPNMTSSDLRAFSERISILSLLLLRHLQPASASAVCLLSFHEFFMALLCCANHRSLRWKAPKFKRRMATRLAAGKLLRESARTLPSKRRDWSSTGSILRSCKGMLGFLGTIFAQLKKRLDHRAKPNPLAWLVHFFWRIANHDPIGFLSFLDSWHLFDLTSIIIILSTLKLTR